MSTLKVVGTKLVNEEGEEIILRGAGLGGWMKWVFAFKSVVTVLIDFQHGELHLWYA